MKNLNELAREIHAANAHWWHDPATGERLDRNKGEMLMLIVSELSEAMEGERKDLMDDKLPHRKMAEVELADVLIRVFDFAGGFGYDLIPYAESYLPTDGNRAAALFYIVQNICAVGDEIEVDSLSTDIRVGERLSEVVADVLRYAEKFGYDVLGAMEEKRAYNAVRLDHKAEARLAAGGKKW
jgi:NTP pyrophosphatase (non-canonical NTP hydrolase)